MSQPEISILIVSWNTQTLLARCLTSIQLHAAEIDHEVIVVDNGSQDGSADYVRQTWPSVELLANAENRGFAAANNQALAQAQGRFVLLLNSDARLLPGALPSLVRFLDDHPTAGVVGPQLLYPDGRLQFSTGAFPSLREQLLLALGLGRWAAFDEADLRDEETPRRVDYVAGAALLARRSAIEVVGGMDERFFMYSEETDWCYRFAQAGHEVWFVPAARVEHVRGGSTRQVSAAMLFELYRSRLLFVRKHRGAIVAGLYKLLMALDVGLRLLVRGVQGIGRGGGGTEASGRGAAAYWALMRRLPGI